MAYPALELITRSYYLSQVVARELQTVSGAQITDGLYLLNSLLDFKGSDIRHIPYFKRDTFDTVVGQEEYFVPNLVYLDALTFNIGDVRYALDKMTRKEYFSGPRVDNIESLPYGYRIERELGGSRIYLYFLPESIYTMKLSGKFEFDEVELQTDLSLSYDLFYTEYMRYLLAQMICAEWGVTLPDQASKQLSIYQKKIMEVSPPDLSIQKQSFFNKQPTWDWQAINLWKGWWP